MTVTAPGTMITSPNYPTDYNNNHRCSVVIRFSQGQRVSMQFLAFNLEPHSSCGYDWLEVRDGDTESADLIGSKLCGEQIPEPIISSGNALYVYFRTDGSVVRTGFKFRVDVGKNYVQNIISFDIRCENE